MISADQIDYSQIDFYIHMANKTPGNIPNFAKSNSQGQSNSSPMTEFSNGRYKNSNTSNSDFGSPIEKKDSMLSHNSAIKK